MQRDQKTTCFPLSPSRCIRIFPILIPLQQARNAFSMLSPLQQMIQSVRKKNMINMDMIGEKINVQVYEVSGIGKQVEIGI